MNFPSHIFFDDINHGYRAALLKRVLCGCFHFMCLWLLISIMKRCAERCALQLYQTSLKKKLIEEIELQIEAVVRRSSLKYK